MSLILQTGLWWISSIFFLIVVLLYKYRDVCSLTANSIPGDELFCPRLQQTPVALFMSVALVNSPNTASHIFAVSSKRFSIHVGWSRDNRWPTITEFCGIRYVHEEHLNLYNWRAYFWLKAIVPQKLSGDDKNVIDLFVYNVYYVPNYRTIAFKRKKIYNVIIQE